MKTARSVRRELNAVKAEEKRRFFVEPGSDDWEKGAWFGAMQALEWALDLGIMRPSKACVPAAVRNMAKQITEAAK